ncbi:MAG: crotonase/enoyl-CoA hydratase family protein [Acidimicrobiales bacterium]
MAGDISALSTEHCIVERRGNGGAVVVVTMNRPEAKNALSPAMLVGMADAWRAIDADDSVRCAVLTGAGGTFCAGMDLKAFAEPGGNPYRGRFEADADLHWVGLLRHYHLRKPLVAAVEGHAVAGGTELLQATDIRVAAASATLGIFEVRRGLFPLGGSTVRLVRQIPHTVAMELLLTGRPVTADEALRIGLVGHVVPDGSALDKALELAELVAANGPLAVEAIKASVRAADGLPEDEALKLELEIGQPIFATADAKEGSRAFAEKRPAVFKRL